MILAKWAFVLVLYQISISAVSLKTAVVVRKCYCSLAFACFPSIINNIWYHYQRNHYCKCATYDQILAEIHFCLILKEKYFFVLEQACVSAHVFQTHTRP